MTIELNGAELIILITAARTRIVRLNRLIEENSTNKVLCADFRALVSDLEKVTERLQAAFQLLKEKQS